MSVTVHGAVAYVHNHDSDTITGFRVDAAGRLSPLANSTRPLTPNLTGGVSDAAEVAFSPNGDTLVVTEKATNTIDTFAVEAAVPRYRTPRPVGHLSDSTSTSAEPSSSPKREPVRCRPTGSIVPVSGW